ncbi:hypothetical protein HDU93_006356, partial [Gonapodya sp. JEL0774]
MGNCFGSPEPKTPGRTLGSTSGSGNGYGSTASHAKTTSTSTSAPHRAAVQGTRQRVKSADTEEDRAARLAAAEERAKANAVRGSKGGALSKQLEQQRAAGGKVVPAGGSLAEEKKRDDLVDASTVQDTATGAETGRTHSQLTSLFPLNISFFLPQSPDEAPPPPPPKTSISPSVELDDEDAGPYYVPPEYLRKGAVLPVGYVRPNVFGEVGGPESSVPTSTTTTSSSTPTHSAAPAADQAHHDQDDIEEDESGSEGDDEEDEEGQRDEGRDGEGLLEEEDDLGGGAAAGA